jgi:hypothetical protein
MTKNFTAAFGLSIGMLALLSVLPVDAPAQASSGGARPLAVDAGAGKAPKAGGALAAGASNADMRLWSFGECDKNFPFVETPAHKECVRVVGSDEAKDARAVHFCTVSHAKDPAEAARCKEAYFANKAEAEQAGFRANPSSAPPIVAPTAAAPKPDKAAEIAAMTRALTAPDPEEPAAADAPAPEIVPGPAPKPSSSSTGTIMLGLSILLLLAGAGMLYLRRVTEADAPAGRTSRKGGKRSTVVRTPAKQY